MLFVARWSRPGFAVAGGFGLSVVGYLMLTQLGNEKIAVTTVVASLALRHVRTIGQPDEPS